MKEREMSATINFLKPTPPCFIPRKIFSPTAQTDSSDNPDDFGLCPCSSIPATMSPMSPLANPIESEMTGQLLSLTINDELSRTTDSFSSSPDTAWNKGAIAFLELLEGFMARQASEADALRFEQLVVEMMDVNITSKIPTSEHIATTLNEKGWNMEQVALVWTVSSGNPVGSSWDDVGIEQLAGKGAVS